MLPRSKEEVKEWQETLEVCVKELKKIKGTNQMCNTCNAHNVKKNRFGVLGTICLAGLLFGALVGSCIALSSGCTFDPCPGQQICDDGTCTEYGRICCGGGMSCPSGTVCDTDGLCSGNPVTVANGCLAMGQEVCDNTDGTQDCAPLGASCCGDHRYCPMGTTCLSTGECS